LALNETGTAGQPGLGNYRWLLVIFGLAFLASWHCLKHFPSKPLKGDGGGHPFRALRYARTDKLFRHALICWMIMGFGNLMMIPIRVEYLTNPVYGLEQNALTIATLILVIPNVFRLLLNPFWGRLFDRINFFLLRAVLNLFFAVGILIFFNSDTLLGMAIGQIFFGIAHAGGDIAWGMWVTKLAPPNRVADYMSVHTFFTGVRGVLAPIIGFSVLASGLAIGSLSLISAGLIVLSAILLIPTIKQTREERPTQAVTEELSE
jgi:predicted MFS family arabinose efflux permease